MSCTYTYAGQILDCKESSGGVKEVYILDAAYLEGYTIDETTKKVLTLTLTTDKVFNTYQLRKQTASMNTTVNTSDENGTTFYQTDVIFNIPKLEASKRLELLALAVGNMVVIVRDNNGLYWIIGLENPVTLTAGTAGTGTAFGDANQYSYTLTELNTVSPREVTQTILVDAIDGNISLPLPA